MQLSFVEWQMLEERTTFLTKINGLVIEEY